MAGKAASRANLTPARRLKLPGRLKPDKRRP
jgi:hypothetical protein